MRKSLRDRFVEAGLLDAAGAEMALAHAAASGESFRASVVRLALQPEEQVSAFIARCYGIPYVKELSDKVDRRVAWKWLPEEVARRHRAVPLSRHDGTVTVAMADPFDLDAFEAVEGALEGSVSVVMALSEEIAEATNRVYAQSRGLSRIADQIPCDGPADFSEIRTFDLLEEVGEEEDDAPVIKLVSSILLRAVRDRASDVHLEPEERESRVRERVDGVLREIMQVPKQLHRALVSRVKIMSDLDIAERRLPQDGRIRIKVGEKAIDLRISTLPSVFGEKVVIRILDYSVATTGLPEIGFEGELLSRFQAALEEPHGIILVTGPTGSGKTTTLYASLSTLNSRTRNIITIEDPVEYNLANVNQIQVNPKAGITFGVGLRSILRQDPDVIMVGEMRDLETAQMAIRAALTGHLVFSTLHTNDAPGALVRLVDMGVAPYLVSSSVICVLAQRLVRKLCPRCRQVSTLTPAELEAAGAARLLAEPVLYEAGACPSCDDTGYKGRLAILELMTLSDRVRLEISNGKPSGEIALVAREEGMVPLWDDGLEKVAAGLTSLDELARVVKPTQTVPRNSRAVLSAVR